MSRTSCSMAAQVTFILITLSCVAMAETMRVNDLPIADQATDISYLKRRGDVRYNVKSDFKSVGDFYAKKLAADQWKKTKRDNLQRNFWVQTFSKGDMTLVVRVSDDDGSTDVRLTPTGLMWAEDDQPSPKDLPYPEEISGIEYNEFLGWIDYSTPSDVKTVANFLSKELEKRKWSQVDTPFDRDGFVKMNFSKDKSTLDVSIRSSDSGSNVKIKTKGMNWDGMKATIAKAKAELDMAKEKKEAAAAKIAKAEATKRMEASLAKRKAKPKQGIDKLPELPSECTIVMDGTTFKLPHIIAYDLYEYEEWKTVILATAKPIKQSSLIAKLKKSGTEEAEEGNLFSWPEPHLELKIDHDNELRFMSFRAKGTPGSGSHDELAGTALVEDGRARGTAKLKEPGDFFDKVYSAEISFDVSVLTRESTPEKRLVDAPRLANTGTLKLGNKTYKLNHVVAYPSNFFDEPVTTVVLSEKSLNINKLKTTLGREAADDYFEFTPQIKLTIDADDNIKSANIWADNTSLSGNDATENDVVIEDGRVRGFARMTEPKKFFDKTYTFEVTFDVNLLTKTGSKITKPIGGLSADSHDGLPVPVDNEGVHSEGSQFRKESRTEIAAKLNSVVTFYRGQLASGEWGQWKENADAAKVDQQTANLEFTGPDGSLVVLLKTERQKTAITLVTRDAKAAKEAGLLPDRGKSRLVVGNTSEREVAITINGREYKIAAGAGAKDPKTGFNWVVPPGNFKVEVKPPGEAVQSEKVTLGADETWGVLISPTGELLALQLY